MQEESIVGSFLELLPAFTWAVLHILWAYGHAVDIKNNLGTGSLLGLVNLLESDP